MSLPFFFLDHSPADDLLVLDEASSRHAVSVLRMEKNEALHLTDGKGRLITAVIEDPHRKKCSVRITGIQSTAEPVRKAIGISLLKNVSRFEWFLEKATEIGITEIIPILCDRTEKQHFRFERMKSVLVSALLQSQQTWLPVLHQPVDFNAAIAISGFDIKMIAHCLDKEKQPLAALVHPKASELLLIGPEGDFTQPEISAALAAAVQPVTLGATRLRTETAGMVGAVLLKIAG